MTEPSDNEVLAKAKSLAHEDGLLWDDKDPNGHRTGAAGTVDESTRASYLVQARHQLMRMTRMSDDGF
jgi:hypothetical protein